MAKVRGTYIGKHFDHIPHKKSDGQEHVVVTARIVHGMENFNWVEVFMASVFTDGSASTGHFWTTLEEAQAEADILFEAKCKEILELRDKVRAEIESRIDL